MNSIRHNYLKIRERTGHEENVIPVLKKNGYGVGCFDIVFAIIDIQKKFYVYSIEEAVKLKTQFPILKEVFVLGGIMPGQEGVFLHFGITPVINSYEQLKLWIDSGGKKFVLQFNTGMNRSGIEISEAKNVKQFIDKYDLKPMIVMSHFACGNNPQHKQTKIQINNFKKLLPIFENCLFGFSASEAIFNIDLPFCNTSRPGAALYGWKVNSTFDCKPAITITAKLYKNENDETCFPMGVKNGIPSNFNGWLMIKNQKVKVIKVSNWEMILDTDSAEEIALLVGEKENIGCIEFGELAKMCSTVPQEIQCRLMLNLTKFLQRFTLNIIGGFRTQSNFPTEKIIKPRVVLEKKDNNLISFKSTIIETRKVAKDGYVGYGATAQAKVGDVFATFYSGYADGLARCISNTESKVHVVGKNGAIIECEIWGRISMDQTTIKIPTNEYENITPGCKVIIFDETHSLEQFVEKTGKTEDELFFSLNTE